ncbi:stage VI sporulation protein D [Bacillaceae bacterium IKA-2]|nr:stage VI sporulation protein D [Bacillaceae bacterium IKA-2]
MTQDHSSKLSFSIEESVWLNKDQEVDEILSLSLEPDITVQESGDYVLIRGGLKLTGEYRSNGNSNPTEELSSLSEQVGFRSIEEVTINEDGTGQIRHFFPIDVTIPQERINSLDDIYVLVESFDYDLPERGCIQLTADVAITGMSTGNIVKEKSQARDEIVESVEEDRSFHYEAYEEVGSELGDISDSAEKNDGVGERAGQVWLEETNEQKTPEAIDDREERLEAVSQDQLEDQNDAVVFEASGGQEESVESVKLTIPNSNETDASEQDRDGYQEVNLKDRIQTELELSAETKQVELVTEVPKVKIPAIAFGVIKEEPQQEATAKAETKIEQPELKQDNSYGMLKSLAGDRLKQEQQKAKETDREIQHETYQKAPQELEHEQTNDTREEVVLVEVPFQEEPAEVISAKEENENALYLTKMLTKGGEEFKKLKMCIVQEDETLDMVANRYEINQSALIRVNRLNDSNVEVGQILYIPARQ